MVIGKMPGQSQAEREVTEIISDAIDEGLHPMASISLADVRKMMILCWIRGFNARLEANQPPYCATCED